MRKTWMTLVLVGLLVLPLLAQRGGGRRGQGNDNLLTNKSVQVELKLDEKQKKELAAIAEKQRETFRKMRELGKEGEFDKVKEIGKKSFEETSKALAKVRESLTSTQSKRLTQIEIQRATEKKLPRIFTNKEVEKILSLTDKQKETIKEALSDLEKDTKELLDDAGMNFKKRLAAGKKALTMGQEVFTKVTKGLTKEQAKTWETAGGEKFDLKEENPFGGGGKRKDKKKETKDDF